MNSIKKHIFNLLNIFLWVFFFYFLTALFLNLFFKHRILTNIYLGNISLQGMKIDTAKENIKNLSDNLNKNTFIVNINEKNKVIVNNILGKTKYIELDENKAVNIIENSNQNISLLEYPIQIFKNFFLKKNITKDVLSVDKIDLNKLLQEKLVENKLDVREYNLIYQNNTFFINNNRNGIKLNLENIDNSFFSIENFTKNNEINLYPEIETVIATRKKADVIPFLNIANSVSQNIKPINLSYFSNTENKEKNSILNREEILKNISVKENKDKNLYLGINNIGILNAISAEKNEIDIAATNAILEISPYNTKKVTRLENAKNGIVLNQEKFISDIEDNLGKTSSISLETKIIEPEIKTNTQGITELLGVGISNFSHSDPERLHNILNAISKINFLLIEPGENFSLGNTLAPFTKENGYVDGLVIKGKKIIPETGGGMCQLGTTMFRSAMNSGMPITERRNHSLRLKYYLDPRNGNPGTDATIYAGSPDLKFINDTGKYIMIKAYGTANANLLIELWGTKDGRSGSFTAPKIISETEPSTETETNIVRELKPGEIHCNGPFKGASTVFVYNRTLPSGQKITEQFWSYYKSQPLICQVGPDAGYFK